MSEFFLSNLSLICILTIGLLATLAGLYAIFAEVEVDPEELRQDRIARSQRRDRPIYLRGDSAPKTRRLPRRSSHE